MLWKIILILFVTLQNPQLRQQQQQQQGIFVYGANLLDSYLPASMQALAYYIDHLQYEPITSTTVEPPFMGDDKMNKSSTTTTTQRPVTTTKPSESPATGWWNPPSWWGGGLTTTEKPTNPPTPPHKPALYAPENPPNLKQEPEGYEIFYEMAEKPNGLANLPLSLIRDIITEPNHDDFNNDVESLDNFLRLYDDNYGRATIDSDTAMDRWSTTSTAGKKRVPPTKPYVEFLLVYDLLKRDAKSSNLSKYEGYSDNLLQDLNELSKMSSARQLHTLFQRMLDRRDIQRSDVVSRIQGLVNDLANPESPTVKALQFIPAMPFLP
ncbi:ecdysone-inducible gene E3 [Musca autumnalis]|uniref:ecdysone-inducible gene E3 n=1 Tax=Musca autumnalis TaxID=221902 RepID=UPI003CFAA35A